MSSLDDLGDRLLVVFDGNCGLCNGWVRWLLRRDTRDRLRFAPSSLPALAPLLARHMDALDADGVPGTVLVFVNPMQAGEQLLVRWAATLALLRALPSPWPVVAACLRWIPRFAGDPAYRLMARYRYRIWGRLETCPIPTPQERLRFL
jgi:predicted DCC family thiol-disulfide oxidoreductase YuxK